MGKIKDLFNGEHGGFFKMAAIATALALLNLAFGPGTNLVHWIGAKMEISRQERQIDELRKDIERMDRRIRMLTSDRDTLEKFARERFLFAEPGDDVFLIDE
ncbi:MAG: septum formation initiator family protein [Bacteroides sp.]|nr:septum formation initiator family protein [Bacteroides sp.]